MLVQNLNKDQQPKSSKQNLLINKFSWQDEFTLQNHITKDYPLKDRYLFIPKKKKF